MDSPFTGGAGASPCRRWPRRRARAAAKRRRAVAGQQRVALAPWRFLAPRPPRTQGDAQTLDSAGSDAVSGSGAVSSGCGCGSISAAGGSLLRTESLGDRGNAQPSRPVQWFPPAAAMTSAARAVWVAPGRLAPAAIPGPLGAGAAAAGLSAGAGVVFLAPGRLAPPAMPSPVTGWPPPRRRLGLGFRGPAAAGAGLGLGSRFHPGRGLGGRALRRSVTALLSSGPAAALPRRAPRPLLAHGLGAVVDAVGRRQPAERAADDDLRRASVHRLLDTFMVQPLADVLFHPHPHAGGAAAQAAIGVPRHLGRRRTGRADRLAQRLVRLLCRPREPGRRR